MDEWDDGYITYRGLLYEGSDFEAWQKCMDTTLRIVNGFGPSDLDITKLYLEHDQVVALMNHDSTINAAMHQAASHCRKVETKRLKAQVKNLKAQLEVFSRAGLYDARTPVGRLLAESQVLALCHSSTARELDQIECDEYVAEDQAVDVLCMCKHISSALLKRIPDAAKDDLEDFWKCLSALVKSFPLLQLSDEIRIRIFSFALEQDHELGAPNPSLLSVNKQIRETLKPIFYERTTFSHENVAWISSGKTILKNLAEWSRVVVGDCVRHLREFKMSVIRKEPLIFITITLYFSSDKGLSWGLGGDHPDLTEESKSMLDKHVAQMEQLRKPMRLQGESIIMALLSSPELWEPGVLRLEKEQ